MRKRRHDWQRVLEEHRVSGKSVKEFCAEREIHPNTFYKMRQLSRTRELVEIRRTPAAESADASPLEVRTGQYGVMVRRGFDRDCLKSVLEVIGELR